MHLIGKLRIRLFDHVIFYVVQIFLLKPRDLFGVIIHGQGMNLNIQLGEIRLLFGKAFVGGIQHGLQKLLCRVYQLIGIGIDLVQAIGKLRRAVAQFLCAIAQLGRAVEQLFHRVAQIILHLIQIDIQLAFIRIDIVEDGIGRQRIGAVQRKIGNIRFDARGRGDFHIQILIGGKVQRFRNARQTHRHDHGTIADIQHAAVVHGNVLEIRLVGQQHGRRQEGHRHGNRFIAHCDVFILFGAIFHIDRQMAALACDLIGGHFLTIQIVAHGDGHRQRPIGIALVTDIRAVGIPDEHAVFIGEGFIAADIFNIGQAAFIVQLRFAVSVVQAFADDDIVYGTIRVRQHIHHFLLIHLRRSAGQNGGQQERQRDHRGKNTLFHISFPPSRFSLSCPASYGGSGHRTASAARAGSAARTAWI